MEETTEETTEENMPSWDDVRKAVAKLSQERGEWAGIPVPLQDMELTLEPRYPYADLVKTEAYEEAEREREAHQVAEELLGYRQVNSWFSGRTKIVVIQKNGRAKVLKFPMYGREPIDLQLNTIGVARAWDLDAELTALMRLRQLIGEWPFKCYMLTGSFLESSPRSNVVYVFRRCRPTIALATHKEDSMRILSVLCMHPIGYYLNSFGGVMVPTDDIIAHLMMMRADERKFWSKCNHHNLWEPEAGC